MGVDDILGNGETETGAGFILIARIIETDKGLQDLRALVVPYTFTIILDRDHEGVLLEGKRHLHL